MKKLKRILPAIVITVLLCSTMTVCAASFVKTTISVGRGSTSQTPRLNLPAGYGRISYMVTSIDGITNSNDYAYTKLHIIMRDANDTSILDTYEEETNNSIGKQAIESGTIYGAGGKWYAQFSTKIDGINYPSFYSNEVALISY